MASLNWDSIGSYIAIMGVILAILLYCGYWLWVCRYVNALDDCKRRSVKKRRFKLRAK